VRTPGPGPGRSCRARWPRDSGRSRSAGQDVRISVAALDTLMKDVPGDSAYARLAAAVGDTLAAVDTLRTARDTTP
jgi:hypothetical protein